MDININVNLMGENKELPSKSNVMMDGESEMGKRLRSKKNVMIDDMDEGETYIDANGKITKKPKAKMIDIAQAYKPEEVVKRETGII
jgi:hypothetical protein